MDRRHREVDEDEIRRLQGEGQEIPRGWRPSQEAIYAIQGEKSKQEFLVDGRESEPKEQKIHYHHIYPKFRGNEKYSSY